MSVCMSLYRVRHDVEYKGCYMDYLTGADYIMDEDGSYPYVKKEKELGAPLTAHGAIPHFSDDDDELVDAYERWEKNQKANAWSDGVEHDKIDVTLLKVCFKNLRNWRRIAKRLRGLPIKTFDNGSYCQRYIPVDEVEYAQGWFFTNRFFKKEITTVFCVTKDQMLNFFKQYVNFNSHDDRGREAVERFTAAWEDGMIFECSF